MTPIQADRLRLRSRALATSVRRPPHPKTGERFLKGPIPLNWLEAAARLPGRSLHAGIALWYAAGLARSRTIPLSNISGVRFSLDRNAKYRALAWLEDARLIAVERNPGRAPIVTILEAP